MRLDYQGFSACVGHCLLSPAVPPARSVSAPLVSLLPPREAVWESLAGQDFTPEVFIIVFPCCGCVGDAVRDGSFFLLYNGHVTAPGTALTEQLGSESVVPSSNIL